jgi:hypothetical protein
MPALAPLALDPDGPMLAGYMDKINWASNTPDTHRESQPGQ